MFVPKGAPTNFEMLHQTIIDFANSVFSNEYNKIQVTRNRKQEMVAFLIDLNRQINELMYVLMYKTNFER